MSAGSTHSHIVHLVSTLNIGGLEKVVYDLVRLIDRERFEVKVVCLGEVGALAEDFAAIGVETHALNVIGQGAIRTSRALAGWLQGKQIDVLHTHNPAPHLTAAVARCRTRIPVLVHTKHGRNYPNQWKPVLANRLAAWRTDCVVAVSHDAAAVSRDVERIPEGKLRVIHNGIDVERFSPRSPHVGPLPKGGRVTRAIHVARLQDPPKDHATLLRAVRLVVDAVPEFHLEIVGDGPHRGQIESLCDELQLRGHVTFAGFRSDISERIGRSGLALLSTLTEGLSITLLEAMAMGLPVVATNVGGNGEVVADGRTGLLVPAKQADKLAEGMLSLIRSPERAAAMGAAGRERVVESFNLAKVAQQYSELYRELLNKKRKRHHGTGKGELVHANA